MKLKALGLALAVASVAATVTKANAATIYSKDGAKLTMKGDIQVQLRQKSGADKDLYVDYDDAELKTKASYEMGGLTAFGVVDYDLHKEQNEETYVGLDFGAASVLVGKTDLPSDSFYNAGTIEGSSTETAFPESGSDSLVLASFDLGPVGLSLATEVDGDLDVDALATVSAGPVDLALAYQDYAGVDTFGISAATSFGPVGVALDYSDNDDLTVTHLSGSYSLVGLGYEIAEEAGSEDVASYYVNVTKKLNKKVSVFGEVSNTDEDDSDMGFLVGGRVKF